MSEKSALKNVSVLVTGATGFVGAHLCRILVEQGAIVNATSRSVQVPQEGITWWQSELNTQQAVDELLDSTKAEIVYHLAGYVSASQGRQSVQVTFDSLVQSSLYFLQAATDRKCRRLILTGSLNEPVGGVDAVPNSPYSAAKWVSSSYARMFHKLYGTPVVLVRLFMGYGPGQSINKVIPSIITSYLQGEAPQLSSGNFTTDWIYIDDMINGLLAAAAVPGVEGRTFDLASGENASVREIAYLLKAYLNSPLEPAFGALPDRVDEQTRTPDLRQSQQALSWKAATSLEEGLQKAVSWYREQLLLAHHEPARGGSVTAQEQPI